MCLLVVSISASYNLVSNSYCLQDSDLYVPVGGEGDDVGRV